MNSIVESIENRVLRKGHPRFDAGDRLKVHFQVVEGTRRRTQVFEGIVIKRQGSGARETFTVRKQSFGVGVERTFPLHSPKIEKLEVAARGAVRRAKLYYLRDKVGKQARVAERRWGIDQDVLVTVEEAAPLDAAGVSLEEADASGVVEAEVDGAEAEGVDDAPEAGSGPEPDAGDESPAADSEQDESEAGKG